MDSEPMMLAAGDYRATWSATCEYAAGSLILESSTDSLFMKIIRNGGEVGKTTGVGWVYGVKAGRYYISALASSCSSWSVTLQRQ